MVVKTSTVMLHASGVNLYLDNHHFLDRTLATLYGVSASPVNEPRPHKPDCLATLPTLGSQKPASANAGKVRRTRRMKHCSHVVSVYKGSRVYKIDRRSVLTFRCGRFTGAVYWCPGTTFGVVVSSEGEAMPVQELVGADTREGDLELAREITDALLATGATLRLFQTGFSPNRNSVEADFEAAEADFAGYVAAAQTFGDPVVMPGGQVVIPSENNLFAATSGITPNNIGGAWLRVNQVGPPLVNAAVLYWQFPTPITIADTGDGFGMKIMLTVPDLLSYAILET